jgi:hypothetical protein
LILEVSLPNLESSHQAFHLQTDGQTERVNQVLHQYFRCIINYEEDDWASHLTLAEFAYNNTIHASTDQTPFYTNYGYHSRFDVLNISQMNNPAAQDLTSRLLEFQEIMKLHLHKIQDRYKTSADTLHKESPPFQIGNKVWLL